MRDAARGVAAVTRPANAQRATVDVASNVPSLAVMRGATMSAVQELLGHATILMTMRYAHLAPEVVREIVRLLDGVGREWQSNGNLCELTEK